MQIIAPRRAAQLKPFRSFSQSVPGNRRCAASSKLDVKPHAGYKHGTARLVIAGIIDVLKIERREEAAPHMGGVKSFDDFFRAGRERAVAQDKPHAAIPKVLLVSAD